MKVTTVSRFGAGAGGPEGMGLSFYSLEKEMKELRCQQGTQLLARCTRGASLGDELKARTVSRFEGVKA